MFRLVSLASSLSAAMSLVLLVLSISVMDLAHAGEPLTNACINGCSTGGAPVELCISAVCSSGCTCTGHNVNNCGCVRVN
jgi:hypothetical protein